MREIKEMKYRNSPLDTKLLPPGIPYIIGNEAAERFSFYGMKAILAVFMTKYLCDQSGNPDYLSEGRLQSGYMYLIQRFTLLLCLGLLLLTHFGENIEQ